MNDIGEYESAFLHAVIYCAAIVEGAFWYVISALGTLMCWLARPSFIVTAGKDADGNRETEMMEMKVEMISNEAGGQKIRKCRKVAILKNVEEGVEEEEEEEEVKERKDKKSSSYITDTDSFVDGHEPVILHSSPIPTPTNSTATTPNLQVPPPLVRHHQRSGSVDSSVSSSSIFSSDMMESHFPTSHKKSSLVTFFESIGHHKHNPERASKGNSNDEPAERPKREPREKIRSKARTIVVAVASSATLLGSELEIPTPPPPALKIPRKSLFRRCPQRSQVRDTIASDTGSEKDERDGRGSAAKQKART
ncbi:hypothetical protein BC937DRAFT_92769 [Endogone sp. FLAS-F59071]|nr:hypothetical protein BC937DRAFT_92769 [Endogone sp. FLAS-F59071]|eukprot:RUS15199.1 hypothetical protein BC937DRAFT_92769 [Endogone sp. FLAS-F59071]